MPIKIATWNVNSIKQRLGHMQQILSAENAPDILLLQELKGQTEAFPFMEIEALGYHAMAKGQKAYNGVAIISKQPIELMTDVLPGDDEDEQSRYIEAKTCGIRVGCIYLPNGNPVPGEKFDYKLAWMERLFHHAKGLLETEEPFILAGDYNVIPEDGDVHDPAAFANDALYQPESQAAFRKILNLGLTEAYRALNKETGKYTWWGYMAGGWSKDQGVRIDHLLLSPQAADRLLDAGIDREPRGWDKPSDHTPVWCTLSD